MFSHSFPLHLHLGCATCTWPNPLGIQPRNFHSVFLKYTTLQDSVKYLISKMSSENPRKRYPSHLPDAQRERNEKKKARKAMGEGLLEKKIKYYVENVEDHELLLLTVEKAKKCVSEGSTGLVSNYKILVQVFRFFLSHHSNENQDTFDKDSDADETIMSGSFYQYCKREECMEDIYLTTQSSIQNLVTQSYSHNKCGQSPQVIDVKRLGHAGYVTVKCTCGQFTWNTSPHIEGGKCLTNMRMIHGYMMSGLLPVQYERLCSAAGIGQIGDTYLKGVAEVYQRVTSEESKSSMEKAIMEEIASGDLTGINIMTDARHGWRRNAKDTDVVCIGENTHKVLNLQHVTRREEPCSQRHELVGTKRIFEGFSKMDVPINIHIHDGNVSVTNYVDSLDEGIENSYDTWHATKGITKEIKKSDTGAQKKSWQNMA